MTVRREMTLNRHERSAQMTLNPHDSSAQMTLNPHGGSAESAIGVQPAFFILLGGMGIQRQMTFNSHGVQQQINFKKKLYNINSSTARGLYTRLGS